VSALWREEPTANGVPVADELDVLPQRRRLPRPS
jgi:hypothetical protein